MKLLFDQNLSPRLIDLLSDVFPGSKHVSKVGLASASDFDVWKYAKSNEYVIASKDSDLSEIGMVKGFPPNVVWIRKGNCTTREIESLLRANRDSIVNLSESGSSGILVLS